MFNHQSGSGLLAHLADDAAIEWRWFCVQVPVPIDRLLLKLPRDVEGEGTVTYEPTRQLGLPHPRPPSGALHHLANALRSPAVYNDSKLPAQSAELLPPLQ